MHYVIFEPAGDNFFSTVAERYCNKLVGQFKEYVENAKKTVPNGGAFSYQVLKDFFDAQGWPDTFFPCPCFPEIKAKCPSAGCLYERKSWLTLKQLKVLAGKIRAKKANALCSATDGDNMREGEMAQRFFENDLPGKVLNEEKIKQTDCSANILTTFLTAITAHKRKPENAGDKIVYAEHGSDSGFAQFKDVVDVDCSAIL